MTRRRALAWLLFAVVLACIGVALHTWLPPEPRWTLPGVHELTAVLPDGSAFLTHSRGGDGEDGKAIGPVVLRDMRTGRPMHSFFDPETKLVGVPRWAPVPSAAGWFAADEMPPAKRTSSVTASNRHMSVCVEQRGQPGIYLVDLAHGSMRSIPLPLAVSDYLREPRRRPLSAAFVDGGTYLVLGIGSGDVWVLESDSGTPAHTVTNDHGSFEVTSDGKRLLYLERDKNGSEHVSVWSCETQKVHELGEIRSINQTGPAARVLVGEDLGDRGAAVVWDLTRGRAIRLPPIGGFLHPRLLSSDDRLLAVCMQDRGEHHIDIWDLEKERLVCSTPPLEDEAPMWLPAFSPDGRYFAMTTASQMGAFPSGDSLFVWSCADGTLLWRTDPPPDFGWRDVYKPVFTPDSHSILVPDGEGIAFHNAATGRVENRLLWARECDFGNRFTQRQSNDGRRTLACVSVKEGVAEETWLRKLMDWLNVPSRPPGAYGLFIVIDLERRKESLRVRVDRAADALDVAWLTDDGRSLLVLHRIPSENAGEPRLECWDVPGKKPLRWVFGVPAALGGLVVGFAGWRRRRRAKRAQAPATPSPDGAAVNSQP